MVKMKMMFFILEDFICLILFHYGKRQRPSENGNQIEMEMSSRNKMVMFKFDDEEEREDDKNV